MKRALIVLFLMIAVVFLLYLLFSDKNEDWSLNYQPDKKSPYGVNLFYDLILDVSQKKPVMIQEDYENPIKKAIKDSSQRYTYISLGHYPHLNQEEFNLLMEFIDMGNQALFISTSIYDTLNYLLTGEKEYNYNIQSDYTKDSIFYNFFHPSFQSDTSYYFPLMYKKRREARYFSYYRVGYSRSLDVIPLGWKEDSKEDIVFLKYRKEKGSLLFHFDPLVFTNYHLRERRGYEYVNKVLAHINPSTIIWDYGIPRPGKKQSYVSQEKSPIDFILNKKELRTAWYLLLGMGVIFLIFGTKRIQKPIPVITYRKNTSLGFVDTISALYLSRNAHKEIARMKIEHFLWFLRNKLGISTVNVGQETYLKIEKKTGVPPIITERIFTQYERRIQNNSAVSAEDVILLNSKIYSFYKNIQDEQRRTGKK